MKLIVFWFVALAMTTTRLLADEKTIAAAKAQKYPPLPEHVDRQPVSIWSDGTKMASDFYLPKELRADQKLPAIVFVAGTGGTKKGSAARMAPLFVDQGFAFLAFDYRGWGESESKLLMLEPMPEPDATAEVTRTRSCRFTDGFYARCSLPLP